MGVDVIASRTPPLDRDSDEFGDLSDEDRDAFRAADIDLHQTADPGTFWGWERWQLVREVHPGEVADPDRSDVGLEWISTGTVRDIATGFDACDAEDLLRRAGMAERLDSDVVEGLRRFFRVCADRGLGVIYWY